MKKYVKPELFYERFELSQHIADCAWEMTNSNDKENCFAVADPDFSAVAGLPPLFTNTETCTLIPEVNYMGYCYHNGDSKEFPHVFAS